MKEAKLSVRNNIANTTEAHARELSWKTQEEALQQEVAILYRNDPLKLLPGGSWELLVGVSRPVLQILTLFQTKNVNFQPVFRPALQEIISSSLRLEQEQKHFLKSIWNSNISLSFYLIWNWNAEYVHTIP